MPLWGSRRQFYPYITVNLKQVAMYSPRKEDREKRPSSGEERGVYFVQSLI